MNTHLDSTGLIYCLAAVGLVKALVLVFQGPLSKWLGIWKLSAIFGLTAVLVIQGNLMHGMSVGEALTAGASFASYSVAWNQFYSQWINRHKKVKPAPKRCS